MKKLILIALFSFLIIRNYAQTKPGDYQLQKYIDSISIVYKLNVCGYLIVDNKITKIYYRETKYSPEKVLLITRDSIIPPRLTN